MNQELLLSAEIWSEEYPRWVIQNFDNTYWNEDKQRFVEERVLATKYEDNQTAIAAIHSLLVAAYGTGKKTSYVVPIVVDVYGDNLSREDVIKYLSEAMIVDLDAHTHGNGPKEGLVLPRIEWRGFRKLKFRKRKRNG